MLGHVIWRSLVVLVAFCVAVSVALAVLFGLGAAWVGDELQAAAQQGLWPLNGQLVVIDIPAITDAVAPALTPLPALGAAVAGEVLRLRSWMYYVLAGGAAMVAIPILASAPLQTEAAASYMPIFATAGFAGGFIYWMLAGRGA